MFINANETQLTNREAGNIFGDAASYNGDYSLSALFRAIVINHDDCTDIQKLPDMVCVRYRNVDRGEHVTFVMSKCPEVISILTYNGSVNDLKIEAPDGWETFDAPPYYLNRYLSQTTRSKVYIDRDEKRVVAVVERRVKAEWIQSFCSMLWVVLPWYYPEKNDDVIKFFKSISIGNKEVSDEQAKQIVIDYANAAAKKLNIRDITLHLLLDGVADRARQESIKTNQSLVNNIMNSIEDLSRQLSLRYEEYATASATLQGLENMEPKSDDSFFQFFRQHNNIRIERISGMTLSYGVTDTLEFYDEEEARILFENKKSWAHNYDEDYLTILKTIFVDKRGIFRVSADFSLGDMKMVNSIKGQYPEEESMPNPHIYNYACNGANGQYYSKYAQTGDWDLAIEQSISATKNWSVGDSTVGKKMFAWIRDYDDVKCIYVTDGSPMEGVTDDCKLISFREYKELIAKKLRQEAEEAEVNKAEEANESEENDNG